jgi:RsiW-degrading membrane proteinase PrsW (M82 family)
MVAWYELVLLAIAPSVFLLWFFRHKERFVREPIGLMTKVFILGAVWVIPAIIFEIVGDKLLHPKNGLIETVLFLYIFVGPGEEFGKYFVVKRGASKNPKFRGPMDGIVLGVAAALGFATIENIDYVFSAPTPEAQILTGIVRAFLSVPGHAFWGAITGFYIGQAKYKGKHWLGYAGLAIASILHATYDSTSAIVAAYSGDIVALDLLGLVALAGIVYLSYIVFVRREIGTAEAEEDHPPGTS